MSTVDLILSVRQLQKKCQEQRIPLYLAFVHLNKAFKLNIRSGLLTAPKTAEYDHFLPKIHQMSLALPAELHRVVS